VPNDTQLIVSCQKPLKLLVGRQAVCVILFDYGCCIQKPDHLQQLEGTHRVITHAVLLLAVKSALCINFGVIVISALIDHVISNFDLATPKPYYFVGYLKVIPYQVLTLWNHSFLSRVTILLLTRDIDIVILSVRLSVCLSVCLSVTRWYCMKTA